MAHVPMRKSALLADMPRAAASPAALDGGGAAGGADDQSAIFFNLCNGFFRAGAIAEQKGKKWVGVMPLLCGV